MNKFLGYAIKWMSNDAIRTLYLSESEGPPFKYTPDLKEALLFPSMSASLAHLWHNGWHNGYAMGRKMPYWDVFSAEGFHVVRVRELVLTAPTEWIVQVGSGWLVQSLLGWMSLSIVSISSDREQATSFASMEAALKSLTVLSADWDHKFGEKIPPLCVISSAAALPMTERLEEVVE